MESMEIDAIFMRNCTYDYSDGGALCGMRMDIMQFAQAAKEIESLLENNKPNNGK